MKQFVRFFQVIFLVLFTSGLFAQGVPEFMYFKFNAPGNQQNYASAPVGTNPAVLNGLTIGGTGQIWYCLNRKWLNFYYQQPEYGLGHQFT